MEMGGGGMLNIRREEGPPGEGNIGRERRVQVAEMGHKQQGKDAVLWIRICRICIISLDPDPYQKLGGIRIQQKLLKTENVCLF